MKDKTNISVVWIDDESQDRTVDAKNIVFKRKKLHIQVFHPKDNKIDDLIVKLKPDKRIPDLFLVDYFLDQRAEQQTKEKFEARALTIAGRIREKLPEHPIYVVTNYPAKKEGVFISEAQAANIIFDKLLSLKEVQRYGHDILYFDALDYARIRNSKRNSLEALYSLLEAPECAYSIIESVLPDELKKGISPLGNTISFANWVHNVLAIKPGILYDDIYTATYLGMAVQYLRSIDEKIIKAVYRGIFSTTNPRPLWWRCAINDILFSSKKAKSSNKTNPWELGPIVFNVPKKYLAKCVVCGHPYPETVGTNIKDDSDIKPVHFKCSLPHPLKKRDLYFDEFRAFSL